MSGYYSREISKEDLEVVKAFMKEKGKEMDLDLFNTRLFKKKQKVLQIAVGSID